jgi:hypothetical protein
MIRMSMILFACVGYLIVITLNMRELVEQEGETSSIFVVNHVAYGTKKTAWLDVKKGGSFFN